MKKLMSLLLAMAMVLSLVSCGSSGRGGGDVTVNDGDTSLIADTDPANPSHPVVELEDISDELTAEDGTVIATYSYTQPTVMGLEAEAQAAVQSALDDEISTFLNYVNGDLLDVASTDYENFDLAGGEFMPYYAELSMRTARSDSAVFSVIVDSIGSAGGAHGWHNILTANFDSKTGERLTFEMLGDSFRETAEEKVLEQTVTLDEEYQKESGTEYSMFYDDYEKEVVYVVADGTELRADIEMLLYPDLFTGEDPIEPSEGNLNPAYYLTEEGVVFIAGEYIMKPYAGGVLEFTIPYDELGGVMNEAYLPG